MHITESLSFSLELDYTWMNFVLRHWRYAKIIVISVLQLSWLWTFPPSRFVCVDKQVHSSLEFVLGRIFWAKKITSFFAHRLKQVFCSFCLFVCFLAGRKPNVHSGGEWISYTHSSRIFQKMSLLLSLYHQVVVSLLFLCESRLSVTNSIHALFPPAWVGTVSNDG